MLFSLEAGTAFDTNLGGRIGGYGRPFASNMNTGLLTKISLLSSFVTRFRHHELPELHVMVVDMGSDVTRKARMSGVEK